MNAPIKTACIGLAVLATASLLSALSCDDGLSLYNEVTGLRVLSVRSTPPALALGQAATIDALVATPDDEPVSLTWELCIYTLGPNALQACTEDALLAAGDGDTFSVEATAELAERIAPYCDADPSLVDTLPSGAILPECEEEGFPATIRLTARTAGDEIIAIKRLFLSHEVQEPVDTNPQIMEIIDLPETVQQDATYALTCVPDETTLDILTTDTGETYPEWLDYSWYIAGAKYLSEGEDNPTPEIVEFKVHSNVEQVRLWIVIRDQRSGVDWRRLDLTVDQL